MGESMQGQGDGGKWGKCKVETCPECEMLTCFHCGHECPVAPRKQGAEGKMVSATEMHAEIVAALARQEAARAKPEPAAGQVWRFHRTKEEGRPTEFVIARIEKGCAFPPVPDVPFDCILLATLTENRRWSCIGIETSAGRVMVGERRRPGTPALRFFDVIEVRNEREIVARYADGTVGHVLAPAAARCPLIPGPLAEAARQEAVREVPEYGYDVHPFVTGEDIDRATALRVWAALPAEMVEAARRQAEDVIARTLLGPCTCSPNIVDRECDHHGHTVCGSSSYHALASFEEMRRAGYKLRPEAVERIAKKLGLSPDPRSAREQRRREIDAILREDARQHPAFATARRCAVMAWEETVGPGFGATEALACVRDVLGGARTYERIRGGGARPSAQAMTYASNTRSNVLAAYERARALGST